ncbi:MAG: 4,5-DOPA dioxygenase extradiol [Bacteroidetes bacterium]|nr:4,5-DOPA dioxygenase extradiol [Bacteroidota bacterium]
MKRRSFLESLGWAAAGLSTMKLSSLNALLWARETPRMPVLFFGHGNPMNAIEENDFVREFRCQAQDIPPPSAILCISAHWETRGTQVTAMAQPRTIHDFGGFPRALYEVQYPAPGAPDLAEEIAALAASELDVHVALDHEWGFDHGTWSVVKHLYPEANIPMLQLSLDTQIGPQAHIALGELLRTLRRRGVLIISSGNLVHNLGAVAWDRMNDPKGFAYDWADEASAAIKGALTERNWSLLARFSGVGGGTRSAAMRMAVPTPDHFLPILYTAGLLEDDESLDFFNDRPVAGSLTMTGVRGVS